MNEPIYGDPSNNPIIYIEPKDIEESIQEADIIVIELDSQGEPITKILQNAELSNLYVPLVHKYSDIFISVLNIYETDTKKVLIGAAKRKGIRRNEDPLMILLKEINLAIFHRSSSRDMQKNIDSIITSFPSDYSGVITIVGYFTDKEQDNIFELFSDWQGTVYYCNFTPRINL